MNFKSLRLAGTIFLVSALQHVNAQDSSIEKPFVSYDDAKIIDSILGEAPYGKIS